jgi:HlyD family secretion protein
VSRTISRVLWIAGVIVVLGAGWALMRRAAKPAAAARALGGAPAVAVQAGRARYGDLTTELTLVGVVAPATQVDVRAQITEPVVSLPVQLGDAVHKGQVVARLDASSLQAQLASAQAALQQAQAHLEQIQEGTPPQQIQVDQANVARARAAMDQALKLYQDAEKTFELEAPVTPSLSAISQLHQQVDQAKSNYDAAAKAYDVARAQLQADETPPLQSVVDQARAAVSQAQAQVQAIEVQLGETVVRAPMDGVITSLPAAVGMLAGSSTTLMTIQSAQPQINVTVPEQQVDQVRVGEAAQVTLGSGGAPIPAHVTLVNPAGNTSTLTFPVVLVPDRAGAALLPGQSVRVQLQTGRLQHVLLIPAAALQPVNGQDDVYVIQGGVAHLRSVKVQARSGDQVAVASGLSAGDQVVVGPQEYLADGARVTIVSAPGGASGAGAQGGG